MPRRKNKLSVLRAENLRKNRAQWASENSAKQKPGEEMSELQVEWPLTDRSLDVSIRESLHEASDKTDQEIDEKSILKIEEVPFPELVENDVQENYDQKNNDKSVTFSNWADSQASSRVTRAAALQTALSSAPRTRSVAFAEKKRRIYYGSSDDEEEEASNKSQTWTSPSKRTKERLSNGSVKRRAPSSDSFESTTDSDSDAPLTAALSQAKSRHDSRSKKRFIRPAVKEFELKITEDEILAVFSAVKAIELTENDSFDHSKNISVLTTEVINETVFDYAFKGEDQPSESHQVQPVCHLSKTTEAQLGSHPSGTFEAKQIEQSESHSSMTSDAQQVEQPESRSSMTSEAPQVEQPGSHLSRTDAQQVEQPGSHSSRTSEARQVEQPESHSSMTSDAQQVEQSESHSSMTSEAPQVEQPGSHSSKTDAQQVEQPGSHSSRTSEARQVEQPESHSSMTSDAQQVEQPESHSSKISEAQQVEQPGCYPSETIETRHVQVSAKRHPFRNIEARNLAQEERGEDAGKKAQKEKINSPEKRKKLTNPEGVKYSNLLTDEPTLLSELKQVNALLEKALCPNCLDKAIKVRLPQYLNKESRFVRKMELFCFRCKKILHSKMTSEKILLPEVNVAKHKRASKRAYKLSMRYVLGSTSSGIGYAKSARFLTNLNIDPLSHSQYNSLLANASAVSVRRLEDNKRYIANIIRNRYIDSGERPDAQGIVNIIVVYDGSWMTRGHGSLIGIGAIIEFETGLVIDVYVSCKHCNTCSGHKNNMSKEQFEAWYETHKEECEANFKKDLSSGSMESNSAVILFKRSIGLGLRYASFIGDEDTATYKKLCTSKVYNDFVIKKINCLNHVSKKVFTQLEKLRKSERLDDRAAGSPSQKGSNFLANIYQIACKSFPDNHAKIRLMMNAAINHSAATDQNPSHELCNPTWCKYQKECQEGNKPGPGWHQDKSKRKYWITENVASRLRVLFEKFTDDSVLDRITGQTQNVSESLHSKIWNVLPKVGYRGKTHVEHCVALIVLDHNQGLEAASLQSAYGLPVGKCLERMNKRIEKMREREPTASAEKKKKAAAKKGTDYVPGGHPAESVQE